MKGAVAIKKFVEAMEKEKSQKVREIRILRSLKHDCIVQFKEAFVKNTKLYLILEYVDKNLLEVLETKPSGLDVLPFE